MLLVLMFHHIYEVDTFQSYINYISDHYPVLTPGDTLPSDKLSICLTFDDAYFDFYHFVFPILQKRNIRAVLGVPVKFISDKTKIDIKKRLNSFKLVKNDMYIKKESFCTWQEIKEMAQSGLVKIASHSLSHQDLTIEGTDLEDEVLGSKKIIQQRLSQEVDTFIYPYGRVNRKVHSVAKRYYKYLMRIGSALNKDWHNSNNMIYRVNGDHLINKKSLNRVALFKYYLKYLLNTIRGK